ncbi:acetyl-CoA carboxylase biotin carboxyl carrier protein [Brevibacillus sp. H7]|uniref:acetyl-CoA carboxylase biotin carboxyl carrier protein n=1 Tax=Brevibacillus sp. H7 TaxID=3349138 RepID=UPI0038023189
MLKIHEIREMIKLIDQSSIKEFELEIDGAKVTMKKSGGVVQETIVPQPVVQTVSAAAAAPAPVMEATPAPVRAETAPAVAPAAPAVDEANLHKIVSPMVGTFYRSPEPGKPAYVQPGDKVTPNKVVCIVEAMKLFNEIEAEVNGEIVKVLVEDGQLVEYGQPLFLVKPE